MTASLAVVVLFGVVLLLLRTHHEAQAAWRHERRELLNRIQHPSIVPTDSASRVEVPAPDVDESHLVGTIQIDPDFGGD